MQARRSRARKYKAATSGRGLATANVASGSWQDRDQTATTGRGFESIAYHMIFEADVPAVIEDVAVVVDERRAVDGG